MIFLTAAEEPGAELGACFVVVAAKAGNMAALCVARTEDEALLNAAGADLVVSSLDDVVAVDALAEGRLERSSIRRRKAVRPRFDRELATVVAGGQPEKETATEVPVARDGEGRGRRRDDRGSPAQASSGRRRYARRAVDPRRPRYSRATIGGTYGAAW